MLFDLDLISSTNLPPESAISAVTLSELARDPHATADELERERRQDRLQRRPPRAATRSHAMLKSLGPVVVSTPQCGSGRAKLPTAPIYRSLQLLWSTVGQCGPGTGESSPAWKR